MEVREHLDAEQVAERSSELVYAIDVYRQTGRPKFRAEVTIRGVITGQIVKTKSFYDRKFNRALRKASEYVLFCRPPMPRTETHEYHEQGAL